MRTAPTLFSDVNNNFIMAPLTEDDRTLIRILRIEKHLNAYQMTNEFPARNWSKNNLNRLIRQIDASASSKRKPVTGSPRSARTADNIARVAELICSQEDNPGTSKFKVLVRLIARQEYLEAMYDVLLRKI